MLDHILLLCFHTFTTIDYLKDHRDMNCGERCEAMINHGTCVQVLINCEIMNSPQKFRLERDSNPLTLRYRCRGPFLERPGTLTGPESDFDTKVSRKVGRVLTSDKVHLVSLADNFTAQFSNLLKLPLE